MASISAIIPCQNEEKDLGRAIESVSWADEVIVVDGFSSDSSPEIAKAKGAKVIQRTFDYPAKQKNWAIPQAANEWVLLLDADEVVSEALQQEITSILNSKPGNKAYWIPRRNVFMDKTVRFGDWKRDAVIRLIQRDECRYADVRVHEEIEASNPGRLNHHLIHYTYKGFDHYLKKIERYTNWGAHDKFEKGTRAGWFHFTIKPWWSFVRAYFLRLGLLDGKVGFVLAFLAAYTAFIRSVKIWRLQNGEEVSAE